MLKSLYDPSAPPRDERHKVGDLYKRITAHGVTFELLYGYYEAIDSQNPDSEPIEMYPDFISSPVYTSDGIPFVTGMQRPCEHFKGDEDEDNTCYQCAYYEGCEELLGVCRCKKRKIRKD